MFFSNIINILQNMWNWIMDTIGNILGDTNSPLSVFIVAPIIGILVEAIILAPIKYIRNKKERKKTAEPSVEDITIVKKLSNNPQVIKSLSEPTYGVGFTSEERQKAKEVCNYAVIEEISKRPNEDALVVVGDFYSQNIDNYLSVDYRNYKLARMCYHSAILYGNKDAKEKKRNLPYKKGTMRQIKRTRRRGLIFLAVLLLALMFFTELAPVITHNIFNMAFGSVFSDKTVIYQHVAMSLVAFYTVFIIVTLSRGLKEAWSYTYYLIVQICFCLIAAALDKSWLFSFQQTLVFAIGLLQSAVVGSLLLELGGCNPIVRALNATQNAYLDQSEKLRNKTKGFFQIIFSCFFTMGLPFLILCCPTVWMLILFSIRQIYSVVYCLFLYSDIKTGNVYAELTNTMFNSNVEIGDDEPTLLELGDVLDDSDVLDEGV